MRFVARIEPTRVSPLGLARATFFTQPSLYHSAGYGTELRGSEGRNRCRPVDIAIVRAQRVIFHFLSLLLVLLRTTLPRLENILSSTSTSSSPSPFRNPSIRWQQGRGPSTRILAPFREEERAILLPCQRRRGVKVGGVSSAQMDP